MRRNSLGDFMWKCSWKFGSKNVDFFLLNVCIFDDPCLSKFGVLRGSCPHPGRQFVGLLCVSLIGTRQQMA